jgi:hypothetical protein
MPRKESQEVMNVKRWSAVASAVDSLCRDIHGTNLDALSDQDKLVVGRQIEHFYNVLGTMYAAGYNQAEENIADEQESPITEIPLQD